MATRPISIIQPLPLVTPGATLTTTTWNNAANSLNGLHQYGAPGFQAHSLHINQSRIPVVGNHGNAFTEIPQIDVTAQMELPGGYSRLLMFGQVDLKLTGGQSVIIRIDGQIYLTINSPLGVSNFYYIMPILPGQLANPGQARTVTITMSSLKSSPTAQNGVGIAYRDGLVDLTIKPLP